MNEDAEFYSADPPEWIIDYDGALLIHPAVSPERADEIRDGLFPNQED